ncbi:PspC domain-containing protein [Aerococcus kribbianus]|uniref:PspC domain-containing protein n=1 Tax=Aerococcus kribbianus TaxID=2999064 RepID=UPI003AA9DF1F
MKRLQKSQDNVMLAGVCAGIADYFGIDPTIVRLIYVLLTLAGGSGVLIYIILAIVMP